MTAIPDGEFALPIFPLPDVVFFPNTRLPLHIFEPRYRRMVRDALESDARLGIVLLRPGWESDYHGAPPIHDCGTLGTIEHVVTLDDGRFNIVLRGDARFRVISELSRAPYRVARVVAAPQILRSGETVHAKREWLAGVARQYLRHLPDQAGVPEIETAGLEPLTNALIMSLALDAPRKQKLLETDDLITRAEDIGIELTGRIETLQFLEPYRQGSDPSLN